MTDSNGVADNATTPAVEINPLVTDVNSQLTATQPDAPLIPSPVEPVVSVETSPKPVAEIEKTEDLENVLGDNPKTEEKIIEEKKSEGEENKEAVPLPEFKIEDFKLPENVKLEEEAVTQFTKLLGELEVNKLDHLGLQEKGQTLIDLHVKGIENSIARLNDYYVKIHNDQKTEWFNSFKNDPELGGSEQRVEETVKTVRSAIEEFGGNENQIAEFRNLMKTTGVGNNPAMIRLVTNMANTIRKYTTEIQGNNNSSNRIVPAMSPGKSVVSNHKNFYS